jgi:hypothetical protein
MKDGHEKCCTVVKLLTVLSLETKALKEGLTLVNFFPL